MMLQAPDNIQPQPLLTPEEARVCERTLAALGLLDAARALGDGGNAGARGG